MVLIEPKEALKSNTPMKITNIESRKTIKHENSIIKNKQEYIGVI